METKYLRWEHVSRWLYLTYLIRSTPRRTATSPQRFLKNLCTSGASGQGYPQRHRFWGQHANMAPQIVGGKRRGHRPIDTQTCGASPHPIKKINSKGANKDQTPSDQVPSLPPSNRAGPSGFSHPLIQSPQPRSHHVQPNSC